MQTFSTVQRNFTNKRALEYLAIFIAFSFYNSLSTIYAYLPPLIGVIFFYFVKAFKNSDNPTLILLASMLFIFEVNYGFILFSTIIYFILSYKLFYDFIHHYINCKLCLKLIYVLNAYIGFWLFSYLLNEILWLTPPSFDMDTLFYIIIEFMILAVL
jgi:hypothetical protein